MMTTERTEGRDETPMKTVEQHLAEWAKQPGAFVSDAERHFIEYMRAARMLGVGLGWMQQVIEWEWQSTGVSPWGPEYFGKLIADLERSLAQAQELAASDHTRLLEALERNLASTQQIVELEEANTVCLENYNKDLTKAETKAAQQAATIRELEILNVEEVDLREKLTASRDMWEVKAKQQAGTIRKLEKALGGAREVLADYIQAHGGQSRQRNALAAIDAALAKEKADDAH